MSINNELSAKRWADLLNAYATGQVESLQTGIGKVSKENNETKIHLAGRNLNAHEIVDITKRILDDTNLSFSLFNRIRTAFGTAINKLEAKKVQDEPSLKTFSARFSRWSKDHSFLSTIISIITLGIFRFIRLSGDAANDKAEKRQDVINVYTKVYKDSSVTTNKNYSFSDWADLFDAYASCRAHIGVMGEVIKENNETIIKILGKKLSNLEILEMTNYFLKQPNFSFVQFCRIRTGFNTANMILRSKNTQTARDAVNLYSKYLSETFNPKGDELQAGADDDAAKEDENFEDEQRKRGLPPLFGPKKPQPSNPQQTIVPSQNVNPLIPNQQNRNNQFQQDEDTDLDAAIRQSLADHRANTNQSPSQKPTATTPTQVTPSTHNQSVKPTPLIKQPSGPITSTSECDGLILSSSCNTAKFADSVITQKIPLCQEGQLQVVNIDQLKVWLASVIPDQVNDDGNMKSKEDVSYAFSAVIDRNKVSYFSDPETKTVNNLLKHVTLFLKTKEDACKNPDLSNDDRKKLEAEFKEDLKTILVEHLAKGFTHCSDRVAMSLKNCYYEFIALDSQYFKARSIDNLVALYLLNLRRQLFTNAIEIMTYSSGGGSYQTYDTHAAATHRYLEFKLGVKLGLGSNDLVEGQSQWSNYAKRTVPMLDLSKKEIVRTPAVNRWGQAILDQNGKQKMISTIKPTFILDDLGQPLQISMDEATEALFQSMHTGERLVDEVYLMINSNQKNKPFTTGLVFDWFKSRYKFKQSQLLDAKNNFSRGAVYIFLRELGWLTENNYGI